MPSSWVSWPGAPFAVSALLLLLGYLRYAPGTAYSQSADAYRDWAFPAFRYSDLIWLYLRDGLGSHPLPYVDYPLEYPPLTGVLSYLLSFAPGIGATFALTYLTLAACALGTVAVLRRLPGANPWAFAAAPALFFYTGYQWDGAAVFAAALALLLFHRERDRSGAIAVTAAVWLKLFPAAILLAVLVERVRQRRYRAAATILAIFTAGSLLVNVPFAVASWDGWRFFYTWNRDRAADGGIWVLLHLGIHQETRLSFLATALGIAALAIVGLRSRGPVLIPLSAGLLLWWLLANKTFTSHLILWVWLAVALIRPAWWVWAALAIVDIAAFQVVNFLNLPNVARYFNDPFTIAGVHHLYEPLQLLRLPFQAAAIVAAITLMRGGAASSTQRRPPAGNAPARTTRQWRPPERAVARQLLRRVADPTLTAHAATGARDVGWWRWTVGATIVYAGATVAMTWPYATRLASATPPGPDPLLQIWLARWVQHALIRHPLALFEANVFYPNRLTLAYTDANIPGAILAAPIYLLTRDPLLTNSLLLLGTFVLAAGGMCAFVTRISGNRVAGFLAGLAYAFAPFRFVHLWHLNWLFAAWMPWLLLALVALVERPSRRRAVIAGVMIAVQTLTSFYFVPQVAMLVGGVVGAALLVDHRTRTRRFAGMLAITLGIAALLTVPLYLPYLRVRNDQGLARTLHEAEYWKATPGSYLSIPPDADPPLRWPGERAAANRATGFQRTPDGHDHRETVAEDALFPGGVVLLGALLALAGWRRRPTWTPLLAGFGIVAVVLSLGPSLGPRSGSGIPLPYGFLFDHVPIFAAMRVPARWGGVVDFAVVALGGLGLAWAWERLVPSLTGWRLPAPRARRLAGATMALGVAALLLAELMPGSVAMETVDRSAATKAPYSWLATQPDGPLMEFPAEDPVEGPRASSARRHADLAMYWSTLHWKPLVNGNSGFVPDGYRNLIAAFISDLRRPDGTTARQISHVDDRNVALLQQLGVRYLLFHRSQYTARDWPAVVAALGTLEGDVQKAGDFGEATIYLLNPPKQPIAEPTMTIWAPVMAGRDAPWSPVIAIDNTDDRSALFSLTRPLNLRTTWYDANGQKVRDEERWLESKSVIPSGRLDCSPMACERAERPDKPPLRVQGLSLQPPSSGEYTVRVAVRGEMSISCEMDVEIVARPVPRNAIGNWWTCGQASASSVSNGQPRDEPTLVESSWATLPAVMLVNDQISVSTSLTSPSNAEIQAWFFLSRPGEEAPWRRFVYRSPTVRHLAGEDRATEFGWVEPLDVPDGVYDLTIWFQRREDGEWTHELGGNLGLGPVVIARNRPVSGPFQLVSWGVPAPVAPGHQAVVRLAVQGSSSTERCLATWTLREPSNGETPGKALAWGQSPDCGAVRPRVPLGIAPGRYVLEITAIAAGDEEVGRSDRVIQDLVVADWFGW